MMGKRRCIWTRGAFLEVWDVFRQPLTWKKLKDRGMCAT